MKLIVWLITLVITALLGSSCTYIVGGDSTMAQLAAMNGQAPGHVRGGCGWSGHGGWNGPCEVPVTFPGADRVVLGVSIWDAGIEDLDRYRSVTEAYLWAGVSVVWVAVPEVDAYHATVESLRSLNERVAEVTGCPVHPSWIREAEMTDGVHYTDEAAIEVARRFETIDHEAWRCPS